MVKRPNFFMMPGMVGAYLERALWHEGLTYFVKITTKFLAKTNKKTPFESIAVCGNSGLLVGPAVAVALKKNLVLVRKRDKINAHSSYAVEGPQNPGRYVIVDDLISTGDTVKRIIYDINRDLRGASCIGVVTYLKNYIDTDADIGSIKLLNEGCEEFNRYIKA